MQRAWKCFSALVMTVFVSVLCTDIHIEVYFFPEFHKYIDETMKKGTFIVVGDFNFHMNYIEMLTLQSSMN